MVQERMRATTKKSPVCGKNHGFCDFLPSKERFTRPGPILLYATTEKVSSEILKKGSPFREDRLPGSRATGKNVHDFFFTNIVP